MKQILASGNKVSVLYDGEKFYAMFLNRVYEVENWTCVSEERGIKLYPEQREEFRELLPIAKAELEKQEMKKPAQGPAIDPLMMMLQETFTKVLAKQSLEKVLERATPMINDYILNNFGLLPQKHEVVLPKGVTTKFTGITHERFDDVLELVSLDIPVFLTGQAGTGKNVICKQVAEALGLEFYFTNAVTQEYQIKGFIDANGTYHETQFYKAFTNGGLFFLDEMDGSIPETLIMLNSAIANRYFDFPTGKVEAHPDFRIISAGNTIGMGADIEYTGRFQLDASSLDRFALIQIDYSKNIEMAVSNNNVELVEFARAFRETCATCGIRCLFTYRSIERITKLEKIFPLKEVLKMSLLKGLGIDDINIIKKSYTGTPNKYLDAVGV